jgi:hypothetical protein
VLDLAFMEGNPNDTPLKIFGSKSSPTIIILAIGPHPFDATPDATSRAAPRLRSYALGRDLAGYRLFFRGLMHHPRAEVFFRVLQVEFFGDGHTIVLDDRSPPLLLDKHGFRRAPGVTRHPPTVSRRAGFSRARPNEAGLAYMACGAE